MKKSPNGGRIKILPPLLAQKIAAGEVIDRPQSVVRELLDNAVDSGGDEIDLWLQEGGNASIIVQDNGSGMSKDDLALCWLPHATSKLHTEADLLNIRTMGFRGEALSSIAAVARLAIQSADAEGGADLEVQGGSQVRLDAWAGRKGTRVEVRNLFFNLPARLQFLKRAGSEFLLCKTVFMDKAAAHPAIGFRLYNEGKLVQYLAPRAGEQSLKERFVEIYRSQLSLPASLHQLNASYPEASVSIVLGRPELYQHDRKLIQVFINRRRVNEYSLVQAVEAGYAGFLPGGRFPVAAVFLEINPSRVDVNIHPAKREVKLMDGRRLHGIVVRMIQDFLRIDHHRRPEAPALERKLDFAAATPAAPVIRAERPTAWPDAFFDRLPDLPKPYETAPPAQGASQVAETPPEAAAGGPAVRYLGQVFGVFLLASRGDDLFMLDFHAAHERVIFDRLCQDRRQQSLLLPIKLESEDPGLGGRLFDCQSALAERGIKLRHEGGDWWLDAVPMAFSGNTDALVEALESDELGLRELDRSLFARVACRSAYMDGAVLSPDQARQLLDQALALPEPRCPHGRPVWFSLSKAELYQLVGRSV